MTAGEDKAKPLGVIQHKEKQGSKSFTARYNLDKLVYYEVFQMIGDAIGREKQLKAGNRAKKVDLINSMNTEWNDLFEQVKQEFGGMHGQGEEEE